MTFINEEEFDLLTRPAVLDAIRGVIDNLNAERESGARIPFDEGLVLLGLHSPLDSLDFVNFVVGLEDQLRAGGFGIDLTAVVVDETANQPFRSVSVLADFLVTASASTA